jgi:hypothetical protein
MPHLARHLALAACLSLIGSVAEAAPKKRGGKSARADVDQAIESDEDSRRPAYDWRKRARERRHANKRRAEQVGFVDETASVEVVDEEVKVRTKKRKTGMRRWHVAFGPNVWAASVDANVAVGAKGVGTAIEFFQLSRHTKYGIPLILEARYKKLSFVGDVLYGVVGINSAPKEIGPVMVKLDAEVSSLLVDGIAGYQLYGDDDSTLTIEARAGIRYQRTAISGSVGLSGSEFAPPAMIDAGGDVLAGARVVVRPFSRISFAGTVDQSLFGSSTSTWSAGVEANVRVMSRVLLVGGWRTLTQQRAALSTVMHGPRVSVQLLF